MKPELLEKYKLRDELLRKVWLVMRDISDYDHELKMSNEDLNVWGEVTAHSAIQDRLGKLQSKADNKIK